MLLVVAGSVGDGFSFFAASVGEFSIVGREREKGETDRARDGGGVVVKRRLGILVVSLADVGDGSDVGGGWGWWSGVGMCGL